MVLVRVCIKYPIQRPDIFPQHLLPEVRAGIDHDAKPFVADMDRRPEPVVFRVSRPAYRAIAADHRNPL